MFEHCLYFNTTSLARKLEREWAKAFLPFGLTPSQAFLLRLVLANPAQLQSELAASMNIARPTATRTLNGLAALGLISRYVSQNDKREYEIMPTQKARLIKNELNQASKNITVKMKTLLGEEGFTNFVTNARNITRKL